MRLKSLQLGRVRYRAGLFLVGMIVLAGLAWTARDELAVVLHSLTPSYFIAAILLGVLFMLLQGVLFAALLTKYSNLVDTRQVIAAFLASQPGKYVPGKIWSAVMQLMALGPQHSLGAVAIANLELAVIGIVHMLALGFACLLWPQCPLGAAIAACGGIVIGFAVVALPTAEILHRLAPAIARWLKINPSEIKVRHLLPRSALTLSALLVVASFAASLMVLYSAGIVIPRGQHLNILAIFYLGFTAAFLAFPMPSGVGVREAAIVGLGLLLAPQVSSSLMLSVALLARLWQLSTDVVCVAVGAILISTPTANSS